MNSVPFGPINNIRQTFEHPQSQARGVTVEVDVRILYRGSLICS
jgi:crotonobetainyl-CoA:carnitine CoA-transferase CaiB-like acyl-CoA transferase